MNFSLNGWKALFSNAYVRVILSVSVLLAIVLSIYFSFIKAQREAIGGANNFLLYFLVNFTIIALCVIVFLVARSITKLIFERKNNVVGSKLRMKLGASFVGLTIVPMTLVVILASGLLSDALQGWLRSQIESGVSSSLSLSRIVYDDLKKDLEKETLNIKLELQTTQNVSQEMLDALRKKYNVTSIKILSNNKKAIADSSSILSDLESFREPVLDYQVLSSLSEGVSNILATSEIEEPNRFVRVYSLLQNLQQPDYRYLIVTRILDPDLSEKFSSVSAAQADYERLKRVKGPLKAGYLLTLSFISTFILFGALWLSFYIARQIVNPVESLLKATQAVAEGNYSKEVTHKSQDELGLLVESFNKMVKDIGVSKAISEERRKLVEAVVSNLKTGVISTDKENVITSFNTQVTKIFASDIKVGDNIEKLFTTENIELLELVRKNLNSDKTEKHDNSNLESLETKVISQGRSLKILASLVGIFDAENNVTGKVFLFDDLTEITQSQSMSAWSEVARRIAHEIKNPLTPIQLSAQRLKKLVGNGSKDVAESADIIVQNVDSIKRLADEFSRFARMPTLNLKEEDLNQILQEIVTGFAEQYDNVVLSLILDPAMPRLNLDKEQLRRALINLIDNAMSAVKENKARTQNGYVKVRTFYKKDKSLATIEIADNGVGISAADKNKIFEPYFTTKENGTGLGLAIVTTIITDHMGKIRVFDNEQSGGGAKFVVELPVSARSQG